MQLLLILLSILPGALIIFYIYWRDRHEPEPVHYLLMCFLFGAVSTYPVLKMEQFGVRDLGLYSNSQDIFMTFSFAFAVIAFSEEFAKYLFLRFYIYKKEAFDEPFDGIVYAVMISMGFATVENIIYVVVRPSGVQDALETGFIRMLTAVPAHAFFAIAMGYFAGKAKFNPNKEGRYLLLGLLFAILLHGTYDFLIFMHLGATVVYFTLIGLALLSVLFLNQHSKKKASVVQ
jgi:RsiW-degrading membrane proteinase PrsW (M82 family)